jgi:DNA-binding NarL/FixJ family response regulator
MTVCLGVDAGNSKTAVLACLPPGKVAGAALDGYLLKDRVGRVDEFLEALDRVASGGTVLDPEVVTQLLTRRQDSPVDTLTPREREVLKLMAEGNDNTTIAEKLFITERAVSKHIGNVFLKLGLPPTDSGHRRVLAVLAFLDNPSGG